MQFINLPKFRPSIPFVIALAVLLATATSVWIYFYHPSFIGDATMAITQLLGLQKRDESVSILPHGKQVYLAQFGPAVIGPKIQKATVDPLDVRRGAKQTVTIEVKHDSPVTRATATLITDHKHVPGTFTLTEGTQINGTWRLTWKLDDTNDHIYQIYISLESSTGSWTGALTFR